MFSVRIFCNSVDGQECFFKFCAVELVSERCIGCLLDRVVEVKPKLNTTHCNGPDALLLTN